MFYSMVPILALVIMFITNFDILFDKRYFARNAKALKSYRIFLAATFIFYIFDILWGYLDPLENKIPAIVDTHLYFIAMALLLFAWTNFVINFVNGLNKFKIVLRIIGIIFALFGVSLVIANIFTPVLFSYDTQAYIPKYWRFMFLGLQISTFAIVMVFTFVASFGEKGYKKGQLFSLSVFSLFMAGAVTAQTYCPLYPMYSLGLAVGTILVFTFIVVSQRIETRQQLLEGKYREEKQLQEIKDTRELAYIDPLTGVRNKHAYVEFESKIDKLIHDDKAEEFGFVIFDLNDLKLINDTYGHESGDQYIVGSVNIIKSIFPNAPIYRFGGDEFIVILKGQLYENRFKLLDKFNEIIDENNDKQDLSPVIAAGGSNYIRGKDNTLRAIFLRADERMYARKRKLKEAHSSVVEENSKIGNKSTGINLIQLRYEMYEMFYHSSAVSLIDMLNGSSCDEILEIDINNDTFKQFYHVDGKYFVPAVGLSYKDLIEFTNNYVVHPEDKASYMGLMGIDGFFDRIKNNRIPNFDFAHFRYKLQDGSYCWVEQVVIAGEEFGIPEGMFRLYVFDINNIKSRQLGNLSNESVVISAGKDQMTGLLVAKEFITKADELVLNKKDKKWCFVSMDIEHFKMFDEWFGREKGNYLLAKIGATLKEFEENNGALAGYFGQDDFVVLCEYDMDNIKKLYDKIHEFIMTFGLSTGFLPAFGISLIDKDMIVVDAMDRASIAMGKAKSDIRNRICLYTSEMQFMADQEYRILTEFIHALQSDEITFYLQPQCRASTGQIIGAEALARWVKEDGTVVSPGQFIPILEKYGFITDLDKRIWEKVFVLTKSWIDRGFRPIPISINVSRIDFFNIDILEHFSSLADKYKIKPGLIEIEITESAYAENMNTADKLVQGLRAKGFKVLIDDFGSGYSSLNMLSTLKIDAIKLDAKFLQIDGEHQRGIHVLESVITMAKGMSLPMIIEGVETKGQIDFLDQFGVRYIQGYYFYKPMPIEEYEKLISNEKNVDYKGIVVRTNEQFRIREFLDKNIYSDSMLNNVIGPVAIYSLRKEHIDIVRYNQQFMTAVDVPDFVEKLENIENTMPAEDIPLILDAFKRAKENKLMGASGIFRFYRADGVLSSFRMHLYYIGKKEGTDRFYGSVSNVTELVDLIEAKSLMAHYSSGNVILVRHVGEQWKFAVVSHNLSDIIGVDPKTLEDELNADPDTWRVSHQSDLKEFIKQIETAPPAKGNIIEKDITVVTVNKDKVRIRIWVENIGGETNNFAYILRSERI